MGKPKLDILYKWCHSPKRLLWGFTYNFTSKRRFGSSHVEIGQVKFVNFQQPIRIQFTNDFLERKEFICGLTGNLSYQIGHERPVKFIVYDMENRSPRPVLRMNDTLDHRGFYGFLNMTSKDIEWGPLGKPSPDADCLDGDMIMCLLADQGIFLHLRRYEPSIIQSNASRANGPFGVVENKIKRNSRNLGIVSTCWFISSLWYCSYCCDITS